jgi:hypothetical protein
MLGYRMGCVVVMLGALVAAGGVARAQSTSEPGCRLEKQVYTCDWQGFLQRLDKAHTVAVETESSVDRPTAKQLRQLATELGKTVAPEDQIGDLTFLLIPMQTMGVDIGPAGVPLATLRIYAPGPGTPRGTLLWAETYTGQPDRPWPAIVHALIEQFQNRFAGQSQGSAQKR